MTKRCNTVTRLPERPLPAQVVDAPDYLKKRGFSTAREVLPEGAQVVCPKAIWVFYGERLKKEFLRTPKQDAQRRGR